MFASACGLALLSLSVSLVTVETAISQNEINNAARQLQIKIYVGTMHEADGTYDVTFLLTNRGRRKILDKKGWEIEFNMKSRGLLTKPSFENEGLQILPAEGCTYKIKPNTKAAKKFTGLRHRQTVEIKLTAEGLSVFKYDIYPRFILTARNRVAKNIESTNDIQLGFVQLAPGNSSDMDMSRMSALQRSVTQPQTIDVGRVPRSIILPSPENIQASETSWVQLSNSSGWYIWPDRAIKRSFLDQFIEKLSALPGMNASMFQFMNRARRTGREDLIILQLKKNITRSEDGYSLAVIPSRSPNGPKKIHISATSHKGLQNALQSLLSVTGLFNVAPAMTVYDDARFEKRSIQLDTTKNFIPVPIIKKLLRLMNRYKLNNLVLNLADNFGWRLEMPKWMDFEELTTFASKRCADKDKCLPHAFGSGADTSNTGSGYYSMAEFKDILTYAKEIGISITPKINLLGSIRSAKKASHLRWKRIRSINKAEANRLRLMTAGPKINEAGMARDTCYKDGVLDPCNQATYNFIRDVVRSLEEMYSNVNITLKEFHAGGDETTRYFGLFPSCIKKKLTPQKVMKTMLKALNNEVRKFKAKLRVREEAVLDPDTKTCLQPSKGYRHQNLIVDFWDIMPGNQNSWGLSKEELEFINAPVPPPLPNTKEDPLQTFLDKRNSTGYWSKKGLAPWAKAYSCANNGYKVVLGPEAFFSLDSAYELDWDEKGNRKKDRFHVINLHRMMMFEPYNLHTNMDTGDDGFRYLPYRLCHMWDCEPIKKKNNILGLLATIDTDLIRTEQDLWESILPEMLLFAEKAWRPAPFENILKAEDPRTLTVMSNIEARAFYLNNEMINMSNNWGYKESGICDFHGYTYRVPKPGAHVDFRLPFGGLPPYPVVVTIDFSGADIEYREGHIRNSPWRLLFVRDENTGILRGGYNMSFPTSNQRIELRTRSTDGRRRSPPVLVRGGTKDLWPQDIPIAFREGTCLPIREAYKTDVDEVKEWQWNRIFNNIVTRRRQQAAFDRYRETEILNNVWNHSAQYNTTRDVRAIFYGIQDVLMRNESVEKLPDADIRKMVYNLDREIALNRSKELETRYEAWERRYQECKTSPGTGQSGPGRRRNPGQSRPRRPGNARERGQRMNQSTGQQGGRSRGGIGQNTNRQMPGSTNTMTGNAFPEMSGNRSPQMPGRSNQGRRPTQGRGFSRVK